MPSERCIQKAKFKKNTFPGSDSETPGFLFRSIRVQAYFFSIPDKFHEQNYNFSSFCLALILIYLYV